MVWWLVVLERSVGSVACPDYQLIVSYHPSSPDNNTTSVHFAAHLKMTMAVLLLFFLLLPLASSPPHQLDYNFQGSQRHSQPTNMSHSSPDSTDPASSGEPRVYFEPQESALCAVHALNNLVQSPLFTPVDLSSAAAELQERERQLHAAGGVESADYLTFLAADNNYVSDEGNFSFECISQCLSAIDCSLTPLSQSPPQPSHSAFGLIANLESHWLTIRRVDVPSNLRSLLPAAHSNQDQSHVWLNLNSLLPRPTVVSDTYLSLFLAQLKSDGYAMFECTTSNAEVIEGAMTTGDMAHCEASRWHSLRAILLSVHTQANPSRSNDGHRVQQRIQNRVSGEDEDDEKAMQAAIAASIQQQQQSSIEGVSIANEPIVLDFDDEEDAELKAAIALSMTADPPQTNIR